MSLNTVTLMGNICKDPETRNFNNGNLICNITVAINNKTKNGDNTNFIECSAFNKTADFINKYFNKGSKILIEGRLDQQTWTDKNTGKNRSKIIVIINKVHFVDSKKPQQPMQQGNFAQYPNNQAPQQPNGNFNYPPPNQPAPVADNQEIPF